MEKGMGIAEQTKVVVATTWQWKNSGQVLLYLQCFSFYQVLTTLYRLPDSASSSNVASYSAL